MDEGGTGESTDVRLRRVVETPPNGEGSIAGL